MRPGKIDQSGLVLPAEILSQRGQSPTRMPYSGIWDPEWVYNPSNKWDGPGRSSPRVDLSPRSVYITITQNRELLQNTPFSRKRGDLQELINHPSSKSPLPHARGNTRTLQARPGRLRVSQLRQNVTQLKLPAVREESDGETFSECDVPYRGTEVHGENNVYVQSDNSSRNPAESISNRDRFRTFSRFARPRVFRKIVGLSSALHSVKLPGAASDPSHQHKAILAPPTLPAFSHFKTQRSDSTGCRSSLSDNGAPRRAPRHLPSLETAMMGPSDVRSRHSIGFKAHHLGEKYCENCETSPKYLIEPCKHVLCDGCTDEWQMFGHIGKRVFVCSRCFEDVTEVSQIDGFVPGNDRGRGHTQRPAHYDEKAHGRPSTESINPHQIQTSAILPSGKRESHLQAKDGPQQPHLSRSQLGSLTNENVPPSTNRHRASFKRTGSLKTPSESQDVRLNDPQMLPDPFPDGSPNSQIFPPRDRKERDPLDTATDVVPRHLRSATTGFVRFDPRVSQGQREEGDGGLSKVFDAIPNVPAWEFSPRRKQQQVPYHQTHSYGPWTQLSSSSPAPGTQQILPGAHTTPSNFDNINNLHPRGSYQEAGFDSRRSHAFDRVEMRQSIPFPSSTPFQWQASFPASVGESPHGYGRANIRSTTYMPQSRQQSDAQPPFISSNISFGQRSMVPGHQTIPDQGFQGQHARVPSHSGVLNNLNTIPVAAATGIHSSQSFNPSQGSTVPQSDILANLSELNIGAAAKPLSVHSTRFNELTANGRPSIRAMLDFQNMPFIPLGMQAQPMEWGVIKISNIPYNATRNEVYAFLGRNARVLSPHQGSAVHIIMDRNTAKTLECYVEFVSREDAESALRRFRHARDLGRHPRIGNRHAEVHPSSQGELMHALFPRAKCVAWHGQDPQIFDTTEPFNSGFKSFVTSEEMVMTVKHAETPGRSPFAAKCPPRVFESLISTLCKFPWWVANRITLATRDQLLWATERLVRVLTGKVDKGDPVLSRQLLRELALTALKAPGFTDDQKVRIVQAAGPVGGEFTLSSFAVSWPFLALGRKSEVEEDVLELYASILREATAKSIEVASPKTAVSEFGNIGIAWPADRDSMTLAEVAEVEWKTVNTLLCEALGRDTTGTVV